MPTPPQHLSLPDLAEELISLRHQAQVIHDREQILRDEMLSRLEAEPEPRYSSEDFEFTVVPSTHSHTLSEILLRQQLEKLGLGPEAVDAALEAAAKPSTRSAYLRISPKRRGEMLKG